MNYEPVPSDKRALRAHYQSIRSALNPQDKARFDASIRASLLTVLPLVDQGRKFIALYRSIRGEVDVFPVADQLWQMGWRVAVPTVIPGHPDLRFVEVDQQTRWQTGTYGIQEPVSAHNGGSPVDQTSFAAVVMPGLAFTQRGVRLGYGGGYYDRWMAHCSNSVLRIGVAYEEQVVDQLPNDGWDKPVDVLVTQQAIYHCLSHGDGVRPVQREAVNPVIGIILAGGTSRRMGTDKLRLPLSSGSEETVLAHVIQTAGVVCDEVWVLSASPPDTESADGVTWLVDDVPHQGPLRALATMVANSEQLADTALIVAGDLPGLVPEVLSVLIDELEAHAEADAVVVVREGRLQPLLGCYRTDRAAAEIGRATAAGTDRMMDVLKGLHVVEIQAEARGWPKWWVTPIHTPDDYQTWLEDATGPTIDGRVTDGEGLG